MSWAHSAHTVHLIHTVVIPSPEISMSYIWAIQTAKLGLDLGCEFCLGLSKLLWQPIFLITVSLLACRGMALQLPTMKIWQLLLLGRFQCNVAELPGWYGQKVAAVTDLVTWDMTQLWKYPREASLEISPKILTTAFRGKSPVSSLSIKWVFK